MTEVGVLPGRHNRGREEGGSWEGMCKGVMLVLIHGISAGGGGRRGHGVVTDTEGVVQRSEQVTHCSSPVLEGRPRKWAGGSQGGT